VLPITNDATAGIVVHTPTTTIIMTTIIITTTTTTTTTTTSLLLFLFLFLLECPMRTPFKPSCHRQTNENKNERVPTMIQSSEEEVLVLVIDDDPYIIKTATATPPIRDPVVTT
jgi:hypothetical protein